MKGLLEAKRALLGGQSVVIGTMLGHDLRIRIIQIRREESIYYGKCINGAWYPIVSVEKEGR